MKNNLKIIIDTNIWIHFLISKKYGTLEKIIFEKKCTLIFSSELFDEFLEVINRPKFSKLFSQKDLIALLEVIEEYADFMEVKSNINVCRDHKDNFLLSLAKDAKADFLITGDNDLLVLSPFETTKIITINDFINLESNQ